MNTAELLLSTCKLAGDEAAQQFQFSPLKTRGQLGVHFKLNRCSETSTNNSQSEKRHNELLEKKQLPARSAKGNEWRRAGNCKLPEWAVH